MTAIHARLRRLHEQMTPGLWAADDPEGPFTLIAHEPGSFRYLVTTGRRDGTG